MIQSTQAARACKFTPEHIGNILNGETKKARRDTKEKIRNGLLGLNISPAEIEELFI